MIVFCPKCRKTYGTAHPIRDNRKITRVCQSCVRRRKTILMKKMLAKCPRGGNGYTQET